MRIRIVAASARQPDWVTRAFEDYARRLDKRCALELVEVALARRTASTPASRARDEESRRMLRQVPAGAHVVALDRRGEPWTTKRLAARLADWRMARAPVVLLIGGPDGLGADCLSRAVESWSLSALTLPHGLARVVAAEALYRADSLSRGHPYHRA